MRRLHAKGYKLILCMKWKLMKQAFIWYKIYVNVYKISLAVKQTIVACVDLRVNSNTDTGMKIYF